ncbi:MAG: hypothetical protein IPG12_02370 [Saprospiraceae bacterium]|nr:hypothetical protein [Saprospiraceae bacterium]
MQNQGELLVPAIIATFTLVFLVVFFIVLVFKYNKNMIRKNNEMFKAVIEAGEREKLDLSRNLHDQVIPLIAISKLQVESYDYPPTDENEEYKTELTGILAKSIHEIRGICHSTSPILFKELGIQKSIANFLKQLSSTENAPKVQFFYPAEIKMAEDSELSIYRILLELINNALKYSHCKNIAIEAKISPKKELLISFQDDGIGTDVVKLGHGLLSIKSRVTLLEGEVQYKSKKNEGFHTFIKLPGKLLI